MLVGVAIAAGITYFALGLRARGAEGPPEIELRLEHDGIRLPDGTVCPVAGNGCAGPLARLPKGRLRIRGTPESLFALAVPALEVAARAHRDALLDDGSGPVAVRPLGRQAMRRWSHLDIDAPGLRLRVVMRADGFWVGSAAGKVLGKDPRGPTLLPGPKGQDFAGLERKLSAVKGTIRETEDSCALLPALDAPLSDVIGASTAIHKDFQKVLLSVP